MEPLVPSMKPGYKKETTVLDEDMVMDKIHTGHWEIEPSEFKIIKQIGEGGMGLVFKAQLRGKPAAAKKLKDQCNKAENAQAHKDLMMELDILLSVKTHPNLVAFYGACIDDQSRPVLFEEFVDGPSLENLLTALKGRRPPRSAVYSWSSDMLRALSTLHQRDPIIIHRDMKPGNLLLTRDLATLKLADFGMGKIVKQMDMPTVQHTGHVGTVRYMAPEVYGASRAHYDEKCDIHSAAMIMWYASVAVRPDMPDRSNRRPDLNMVEWIELRKLLQKMWNPDPNERPAAAACLLQLEGLPGKPERLFPGELSYSSNSCHCTIL